MFIEKPSGIYYKIENTQDMQPFFINIVSSSDVWIFMSSQGSLTAGRSNPSLSIFPYETEDKLHLSANTGSKTLVRLQDGRIWEPFNTGYDNPYSFTRNIYKRITGDAVIFEEINHDLSVIFSCLWETSEKYGVIRTSSVTYTGEGSVAADILDGVTNILPYGIPVFLDQTLSCLTDAYKVSQRYGDKAAVYSLTSQIADTPEPVEVLRANTAWHIGDAKELLLSSKQVPDFVKGNLLESEEAPAGRKGSFLVHKTIELRPDTPQDWVIVMDAGLSQSQIIALCSRVNATDSAALRLDVEADIKKGTDDLEHIVAAADGFQHTSDTNCCIRHYMNVLYNNMRGGVFSDGYKYKTELFREFIKSRNLKLYSDDKEFKQFMEGMHDTGSLIHLHREALITGNPDIIRLCMEFLPLVFSRRHGDPSRPWNNFNIRVKDDEGNRIYGYEGNWRDIFQNWEAMSLSFPCAIAPIIVKFLNASTADGYNPYRITSDGIDWEIPEPDNPWNGFGYWGDHQIVYLTRLLERLEAYRPDDIKQLIKQDIYTYADVPYEIVSYADILRNSKDTIKFNYEKHDFLIKRSKKIGADGKLLHAGNDIYRASFFEKLFIPVLAKLSNLVPGGGIWMNTNRPEWNDANNAIVGNGLSMVTVYQLYRHLGFCLHLLDKYAGDADITMPVEVYGWMQDLAAALIEYINEDTSGDTGNHLARAYLDAAGAAFEKYRNSIYKEGFKARCCADINELKSLCVTAQEVLADAIKRNKRDDGMYHSYNILTLDDNDGRPGLSVSPLFLMLEGQSAVLGSGFLSAEDTLSQVEAMEKSPLMSDEHKQFYLYPKKQLKTFIERNIIPGQSVVKSKLLTKLLADGTPGFVLRDDKGNARFHESVVQSSDVKEKLDELQNDGRYSSLARAEADLILEIYEDVFRHKEFTGRSGIMYKYEGIGSIYWHQNAKFLVSLSEVLHRAMQEQQDAGNKDKKVTGGLYDAYYRLRAGFGFNKTAQEWGAFPLEPYSHTPYGMPAQQPGMTGQVKEDILTRMAELGVHVEDGILSFKPYILRLSEFICGKSIFRYIDIDGRRRELPLRENSLAFTVCGIPVVYYAERLDDDTSLSELCYKNSGKITVYNRDDKITKEFTGLSLDSAMSSRIFMRDTQIGRIEVVL